MKAIIDLNGRYFGRPMATETKAPMPHHEPVHPLQRRLDEIMCLYLTDAPIATILPLVDAVFEVVPNLDQQCQLLEYLPRVLTTRIFVRVLEKERSRRSAQIARANLPSLADMQMDDATQRKVLLLMHECLACDPASTADSQQLLLRYLGTFNKVDEHTEEVGAKACEAILNTLRMPIWQFDDVSDLVPIRALASSKVPAYRELYRLLDILCYKGDNEYQAFLADNAALLEEWKLDRATLNERVRLLSLCRLALDKKAQNGHSALTYAQIASHLNINEDEVEAVVVRAVGLQLLTARVDQVQRTVRVGYTHHAMFTHDQWKQLQETLGAWKGQVGDLLGRFEELKAQAGGVEVN